MATLWALYRQNYNDQTQSGALSIQLIVKPQNARQLIVKLPTIFRKVLHLMGLLMG